MHRNEYDTIKFTLDLDLCQQPAEEIKKEYYRSRPTLGGYSVDICSPALFGWFGFNFIKINEAERTVFLEISSKILRGLYAQGLHSENFSTAIDEINRSGLLYITPEALETAEATWLDPKIDRILPRPHAEMIRIIKAVHVPNKFKVATGGKLSKRTFQTLYFERNVVSDKLDYIFRVYCKGEEIKSNKNLAFLRSLQEMGPAVVAELAGKVRIERSLKNKAAIRKAYGLAKDEKTWLLPLLRATVNPLSSMWQEILKDFEQAKPITVEEASLPIMNPIMNFYKLFIRQITSNPHQRPTENMRDVSTFTELMAYHFDMVNVAMFVKDNYTNKNTRTAKMKAYRSMLSRWQQFQNNITSVDFEVFAEISAAIKDKPAAQAAHVAASTTTPAMDVQPVAPTAEVQKADEEFFNLLVTIVLEEDYLPY